LHRLHHPLFTAGRLAGPEDKAAASLILDLQRSPVSRLAQVSIFTGYPSSFARPLLLVGPGGFASTDAPTDDAGREQQNHGPSRHNSQGHRRPALTDASSKFDP
jgi:hypothetical protein